MPRPIAERRSKWPAVLLVVLLLPAPYVLSIGPATRLCGNGWMSVEAYLLTYAPLIWVGDQSEIWDDSLDWYCELFSDFEPKKSTS